jgi:hypothetical protein
MCREPMGSSASSPKSFPWYEWSSGREQSLCTRGVANRLSLDLVQKLSLESLTWELLPFRLPMPWRSIPCFKVRETEVCLVVMNTLCSFNANEVCSLKTLTDYIDSWRGASYYCRGTLYCSSYEGRAHSYEIGSLSN